jgi:hypothetical protein
MRPDEGSLEFLDFLVVERPELSRLQRTEFDGADADPLQLLDEET